MWRRVLTAVFAAWTLVALTIPGDLHASSAADAHCTAAAPASTHASTGARASDGGAHGMRGMRGMPSTDGAHHGTPDEHAQHAHCADCCCAAPVAFLSTDSSPAVATQAAVHAGGITAPDHAPHGRLDFLHPFPNGPPPAPRPIAP